MVRAQLSIWDASSLKQRRDARTGNRAPINQRTSSAFPTAHTSPAAFSAWRTSDLRQGLHALAKVVTFGRITA
jgi:hypothetical protein